MANLTREQYIGLVNTKKALNDNFTLAKSCGDTAEMFEALSELASLGLISEKDNRVKPGALEKYAWIDNGAAIATFQINMQLREAFEAAQKEYGDSNRSSGNRQSSTGINGSFTGMKSATEKEIEARRAAKLVKRSFFNVKVTEHIGERREYSQVGTQVMRGFEFEGSAGEVQTAHLVKSAVAETGVLPAKKFIGRLLNENGLEKFLARYKNKTATMLEFKNYDCGFSVKTFGYAIVEWNPNTKPVETTVRVVYNFEEMLEKFVDIKYTVGSIENRLPEMLDNYMGVPTAVRIVHDGKLLNAIERQKEILAVNRQERQQFINDVKRAEEEAKLKEKEKAEKVKLREVEEARKKKERAERKEQAKREKQESMKKAADTELSEERKRELAEMIARMTPEEREALKAQYSALNK